MTLSVRSRFEVFKRDGYTCGYCGRTPDDEGVKLVVDHITPRSAGGSDDLTNLVTSCWECNSGKSDKSLEDKAPLLAQAQANTRERALQLDEYRKWQATLDDVTGSLVSRIWDEWIDTFGGTRDSVPNQPGYMQYESPRVDMPGKAALLRYFDLLETAQIIDAIHGTYRKWAARGLPDHEVQRYFFGTLKRKAAEKSPVSDYQTGEDNGTYLENRRLRDLFINHEAHGFATYADVVAALWPSDD